MLIQLMFNVVNLKEIVFCVRKMNSHPSIVKNLIFRSITGQKLGVDVHQHLSMEIHLCWSTIIEPGYYKNCIVRRISTFQEYNEFMSSIQRSSKFDGACVCCYSSVFTVQRKKAKRCIYTDGRDLQVLYHLKIITSF